MKTGELLQAVAVRLVAGYLTRTGALDVRTSQTTGSLGREVDLSYVRDGEVRRVKVKGDSYFGADDALTADLSLPFYRADVGSYALETIADASTRAPGWIFTSEADEIYYLFAAMAATEEQLGSALGATEEAFLKRIALRRNELHMLPMAATREWLTLSQSGYPARPVTAGRSASWVRLVPTEDLAAAVPGVRVLGSVLPD